MSDAACSSSVQAPLPARRTVRPGATLSLTLSSGEVIRVSTHDPAAARRLLTDDPDHDPPAPAAERKVNR